MIELLFYTVILQCSIAASCVEYSTKEASDMAEVCFHQSSLQSSLRKFCMCID